MNDKVNMRKVKPSCSDIGSDNAFEHSSLEIYVSPFSSVLGNVSMKRLIGDGQVSRQGVDFKLSVTKNQDSLFIASILFNHMLDDFDDFVLTESADLATHVLDGF